jgi:hypothetical protein
MMRTRWIVVLVLGGALLAMSRVAHVQAPGIERALVERFGFLAADMGQLGAGQVVTRTLPAEGREMGVVGAVRIPDDKERLVRWIRDVEGFRKAADLGLSRKLSSPPTINDFGDLALDAGELAALQQCQPGACALRLGETAIARFRADVDWSAADAGRRANLLTRQLLLAYAQAYLRGGDGTLGAAHNERTPRVVADEFRALIRAATNLHALAGPLAAHLERFPQPSGVPVEEFLYWGKGGLGPEPSITLHHLIIQRDPGGGIYVANKQLYASRYVDAGLLVLWLAPPADGRGYYLLAGMRARSSQLERFAARMLRSRIEEESRSYLQIYLDWLRRSLSPA